MPHKRVLLSLGSNIGDRLSYLKKAIDELGNIFDVKVVARSTIMETSPVGVIEQSNYLNTVLLITTSIEPAVLIKKIKAIELKLGRQSRSRWAEREIDIDILIYEGVELKTPELSIPHVELSNRLFVLKGCSELWPECIINEYNSTVKSLYLSRKETLSAGQIVLDTKY